MARILGYSGRGGAEALQKTHMIWLDNLFTSAKLLSQLRKDGYGAAGTVRTSKTAREEQEALSGTAAEKKSYKKEKNRGLAPQLADLKNKHSAQLK